MQRSENISELAKALATAQGQMALVKKTAENPYFKSKYADLGQIIEAVRKPLSANGLAITQLIQPDPEQAVVETVLIHTSGEWISSVIQLKPVKVDPQGIGSALTYARRYALSAILGVASEDEDDDAEAATTRVPATSTTRDAKTPTKPYTKSQPANATEQWKSFWGSLKQLGWTQEKVYAKLGIQSMKADWLDKGKTLRQAYDLITATPETKPYASPEPHEVTNWAEFWTKAKAITGKPEDEIPGKLGLRNMDDWTGTLDEALEELKK